MKHILIFLKYKNSTNKQNNNLLCKKTLQVNIYNILSCIKGYK